MGYETIVTCDECGKDITAETQVRIQVSSHTMTPAPPPAEGEPLLVPPAMQSASAETVLCEEHGAGRTAKAAKLVPQRA